jgi:hypothetical protein
MSIERNILRQLAVLEAQKQPGSVLVQPATCMAPGSFPIHIAELDALQLHDVLVAMVRSGLIDTGGLGADCANVGIFFRNITPTGRRFMAKAA